MPHAAPQQLRRFNKDKLVLPERAVSLSPRKKQPVCPLKVYSDDSCIHGRNLLTLHGFNDWPLPSKERRPLRMNEPFSDSISH